MLLSSFYLRELFHLNLLRHLSARLAGREFALKGGICLRFFHRSPRLSEDMDLDIASQVRTKTLENAVDSIAGSRSFLSPLIPRGIVEVRAHKPKQTETTQRWKFTLLLSNTGSLSTKVEFSRRRKDLIYSTGIPSPEILSSHTMVPFATHYYDADSMVIHKINALASSSRHATRDLFDLYHLFNNLSAKPKNALKQVAGGKDTVQHAIDKVSQFSHRDFRAQVLPFLTESLMQLYQEEAAFNNLKSLVEDKLIQMLE